MNSLRNAAQAALEALELVTDLTNHDDEIYEAITALRAALEQQAEPDAYGYASRLAVAIWEKHYKDAAPQWTPLDGLMGVLTQIDNMTSGLTRLAQGQAEPLNLRDPAVQKRLASQWGYVPAAQAEPVEEPVYKVKVTGRWHDTEPLAPAFSLPDGEHLLYTAPPQRKPLPKHDQHCVDVPGYGLTAVRLVRAVERAHGIKE